MGSIYEYPAHRGFIVLYERPPTKRSTTSRLRISRHQTLVSPWTLCVSTCLACSLSRSSAMTSAGIRSGVELTSMIIGARDAASSPKVTQLNIIVR